MHSAVHHERTPQGGESVALARMEDYLSDTDWVARFEKPKGNPAALERPATTVLSPYLKFGCLSARLFHQRLLQVLHWYCTCKAVAAQGLNT